MSPASSLIETNAAEIIERKPIDAFDYWRALACERAGNLSGIAHSLAEIVTRIRREPDCDGTDYVNRHPIVIAMTAQMLWLATDVSVACNGKLRSALEECRRRYLALGGDAERLKSL